MTTLYLKADDSIAPYVILSGDPWRVETLAGLLDEPRHVAFAREYNTYTGSYRGVPVTISSTGIGGPSAAIAMEELYECGMRVAVRMGTVMALQDDLLGRFVIPVASIRAEGTTDAYAPPGYPAVADFELLRHMNDAVAAAGSEYVNGLNCTLDGFYTHMKHSRLSRQRGLDIEGGFDDLRALGVQGLDMESATVLTLARLMGIRGVVVTLATVLEGLKGALEGETRKAAEALLCQVALEGIHRFAQEDESHE
ncbi:MAG: nucleoside phosphorylase [Propionibacteriaceae bacterium]|nr:nucleoside phosphorylase [Propionibacteriaceae bacterium]